VNKFSPEKENLKQLLRERDLTNQGKIPLGVPYFDDVLGGVYPRDLLLVGAATGVGKTELAVQIAQAGAKSGIPTYLFALEAEPGEVSARLYYNELGKLVRNPKLDFGGWWRGDWPHLDAEYGDMIRAKLEPELKNLNTLYKKKGDFTPQNLSQELERMSECAGLVVLDHIHVIDPVDNDDLKAQQKTVRILRDLAIEIGIPVVAVSHIRKKNVGNQSILIPEIDDLHGSSSLPKIATQVVVLARDWNGHRPAPHLSPTFMQVPKDRRGRGSTYVARVYYDLSLGRYEKAYELGRIEYENRRPQFRLLDRQHLPHYAKNEARRLASEGEIGI
jgi:replicative DNA helicase